MSQENVEVVRRYRESAVGDPPPPGAESAFTQDSVATCTTYLDSTSRITGDTVPVRLVEIITVRDGKLVELVPYYHDGYRIVMTGGDPKQPW